MDDSNYAPHEEEATIETIYEAFDMEPTQAAPEHRRLGRKKKIHGSFPKRSKKE